jgi:hypothetical protein
MSGPVKRIIETEIEYVDPTGDELFTEEEQLDQCCEEVDVDVCADVGKVSRFISRDQEEWNFDPDELAIPYQQQYGEKFLGVDLHAVGPQGDCGVKEETWEGRLNCCDEVEPLVYDKDNSVEVLDQGRSGIVRFIGGRLPAFVKVRGNGFNLDGYSMREGWTYSRSFRVYADSFACGAGPITIDDGCTITEGWIRSATGIWVFDRYVTCDEIPGGAQFGDYLEDGASVLDKGRDRYEQEIGSYLWGSWHGDLDVCADTLAECPESIYQYLINSPCGDGSSTTGLARWNSNGCLAFNYVDDEYRTWIWQDECAGYFDKRCEPESTADCPSGTCDCQVLGWTKNYSDRIEKWVWVC